jgi:hypothetical protein
MNSPLLSNDAYAIIRGIRHLPRIKAKFIAAKIRKELLGHGMIVEEGEYVAITKAGMAVPHIVRAASENLSLRLNQVADWRAAP